MTLRGGRTMVKELFYDWFGLNEWLFTVLYSFNHPYLDAIWKVASHGYGYWVAIIAVLAIGFHYLRIRRMATERQLERMGERMVVLIMAFSVVWCVVYTFQNVTLLPRPWMVFPGSVAAQAPLLWHEGLPASAPAMSVMIAGVFWKHAGGLARRLLLFYVFLGCLLSMLSGVNWPVEVVAGALVGLMGVRLGQWSFSFGRKLAAP